MSMPRVKRPNPLLTTQDVLAAHTMPQLLRRKMDQKGITLEKLADQIGISQSFLRGFINQTETLFQWRTDALERLLSSPSLCWEPEEKTRLLELHQQLPVSRQRQSDTTITSEQLLATTTLNDFLTLKTQQLGMEKGTLRHLAGISEATLQEARRTGPRARQLMAEALEGLIGGLKLDSAEAAHLISLNAMLPPAQNHHSSFHHRQACLKQAHHNALSLLDMTEYRAHPDEYTLPTLEMLLALRNGDADVFNQARRQHHQDKETLLYLRGFMQQETVGLGDIGVELRPDGNKMEEIIAMRWRTAGEY